MDASRALSEIEPAQFEEWQAAYDLEPWGDDWKQAALIAATIRNSAMGATGEAVQPEELIPTKENRQQTDEVDEEALTGRWKQKLGF